MQSTASPGAGSALNRAAWRRWAPTLIALLVVALCIVAGNWQRSRMHYKERLGRSLEAAQRSAPVALPEGIVDWTPWQFRLVDVQGAYDARQQILIDNKVHAGRVGYHVVAPLALADGRAILVNRGFAPGGPTRADLPSAPPPAGDVRVRGRLRLPASDYVELDEVVPAGNVWQNLDPARFTQASGLRVMPVVIDELDGPDDGLVREWPRPDASTDTHRIYMMQWYGFAVLAVGAWSWFTFWRRKR